MRQRCFFSPHHRCSKGQKFTYSSGSRRENFFWCYFWYPVEIPLRDRKENFFLAFENPYSNLGYKYKRWSNQQVCGTTLKRFHVNDPYSFFYVFSHDLIGWRRYSNWLKTAQIFINIFSNLEAQGKSHLLLQKISVL